MEMEQHKDEGAVVIELTTKNLTSRLENLPDNLSELEVISKPILKIPNDIKKVNPKAFLPQRMSFGPYHHGVVHLYPMEKMKFRSFQTFQRFVGLSVEDIVKRTWGMVEDLQRAYDDLDDKWIKEPQKFLELMIVDGCCILQHLLDGDSINQIVLRDMLLLENQVPMTLLQKLHFMVINQNIDKKVDILVRGGCKHLLDMFRLELILRRQMEPLLQRRLMGPGNEIQLATLFRKAGIKIKQGPLDFDEKQGVLRLPFINMNAHIESALLNAMAFEKLSGISKEANSFIILMGNLIEKDEIESFNQLAKSEVLEMWKEDTFVYNKVRKYCNRPWRIWWTRLKDTNFQNPWTIISTLAAIVGFVLLILQTLYGIYGYYKPHSS